MVSEKLNEKFKFLEKKRKKLKKNIVIFFIVFFIGTIFLSGAPAFVLGTVYYPLLTITGFIILLYSLFLITKIESLTIEEKILFNFLKALEYVKNFHKDLDEDYKRLSAKHLEENVEFLRDPLEYPKNWSLTMEFNNELKKLGINIKTRILPYLNKLTTKKDSKKLINIFLAILSNFIRPTTSSIRKINYVLEKELEEEEKIEKIKLIKEFLDSHPKLKKYFSYTTIIIVCMSISIGLSYLLCMIFVLDFKSLIASAFVVGGALSATFLGKSK
jgi:hypothetical protein